MWPVAVEPRGETFANRRTIKKGELDEACFLLGRPYVDGSSSPRQAPGWTAVCRERHLSRAARLLRNAKVSDVVALHGFNARWGYFPRNRVIPPPATRT